MGVQFDTENARRMAEELARCLGVSERFIVEESLRTQMEEVGLAPPRDEGTRRAAIIAEHYRAKAERLPPAEREAHKREAARRMAVIRKVQQRIAELPVLDPRPIDEIMRDLYDEDGIPK